MPAGSSKVKYISFLLIIGNLVGKKIVYGRLSKDGCTIKFDQICRFNNAFYLHSAKQTVISFS